MKDIGFYKNNIDQLGRIQPWMYNFVISDQITTSGKTKKGQKNKAKTKLIQQIDMSGLNVIDVGCAEGLFSFYMAEQGANVFGVELDEIRIQKANLIKDALGMNNLEFRILDLMQPEQIKELPGFQIGFCYAILHRVPDPFNLIGALASKCDALIFEWQAPHGFISNNISLAFHPIYGTIDHRNTKCTQALDVSVGEESGGRKPFWNISEGAIMEVCRSYGFREFKVIDFEKPATTAVTKAWAKMLKDIYFRKQKPIGWSLMKRVILICERFEGQINYKPDVIVNKANWDGSDWE